MVSGAYNSSLFTSFILNTNLLLIQLMQILMGGLVGNNFYFFMIYKYIFNRDPLHKKLNSHYEARIYKKKMHKKITAHRKSV